MNKCAPDAIFQTPKRARGSTRSAMAKNPERSGLEQGLVHPAGNGPGKGVSAGRAHFGHASVAVRALAYVGAPGDAEDQITVKRRVGRPHGSGQAVLRHHRNPTAFRPAKVQIDRHDA